MKTSLQTKQERYKAGHHRFKWLEPRGQTQHELMDNSTESGEGGWEQNKGFVLCVDTCTDVQQLDSVQTETQNILPGIISVQSADSTLITVHKGTNQLPSRLSSGI